MKTHSHFARKLIDWYKNHYRDLPWRKTSNPYRIWISEIILQQTKVQQGISYFQKFIDHFPGIEDLASASQQDVLELWQGLGYYQRAMNLHKTAQIILKKYDGIFPSTYDQLIKLPGIGDYTASAILSFCFGKPYGVVDGNVYRFFARYFGIDIPLGSSLAWKTFKKLSNTYLDVNCPDLYNQAIIEYGALVCTYRNPLCPTCIFQKKCYAFSHDKIHQLPVKKPNKHIKTRFFNYLVIQTPDEQFVLEKRETKDIWLGLYQFPLVESNRELQNVDQLISEMGSIKSCITNDTHIEKWNQKPIIHRLSHQKLFVDFWIIVHCNKRFENTYSVEQLSSVPLPVILSNFVKEYFWKLHNA